MLRPSVHAHSYATHPALKYVATEAFEKVLKNAQTCTHTHTDPKVSLYLVSQEKLAAENV